MSDSVCHASPRRLELVVKVRVNAGALRSPPPIFSLCSSLIWIEILHAKIPMSDSYFALNKGTRG